MRSRRARRSAAPGTTGLAGGDHLHFTMLVGGVQVNPVEWWDPHWMEDRVFRKIREAGGTPPAAAAGEAVPMTPVAPPASAARSRCVAALSAAACGGVRRSAPPGTAASTRPRPARCAAG